MKMPTTTRKQLYRAGMHESWLTEYGYKEPITLLEIYRKYDADTALWAFRACKGGGISRLARQIACEYTKLAVQVCFGPHTPHLIDEAFEAVKKYLRRRMMVFGLADIYLKLNNCTDIFKDIKDMPLSPKWNSMCYQILKAARNTLSLDVQYFLLSIAIDSRIAILEAHGDEAYKQARAWQENYLRETLEELV